MITRQGQPQAFTRDDNRLSRNLGRRGRLHRPWRCRMQLQARGPSGDSSGSEAGTSGSPPPRRQQPEVGAGLKAVWYGAEQFGKLVSLTRPKQQQQQQPSSSDAPEAAADPPSPGRRRSREDILAAIRRDYDVQYFVRGLADMEAYAPDCVFADPFVSFSGTQRFKQNVSNLGGLMSDIRLDVYEWVEGTSTLETRWRFSALLDLPWRPRLAAAGGTTHIIDLDRGLVVRHEERWDVEPAKVVAQLLQPTAKVPTNPWETFLLAASAGDGTGVWFVLSPLVLRLSAAAAAASLAWGVLPWSGGQGLLPGPVLLACELAVCGCVVTEVIKFAQGMQGGETGTGGRF
ncbi:hypothetical protein VOLCADRAFT_94648 [Volvox carteri f. nagariensis]|uniref:Uncharacterized protein n=1 Tax=Volvox carteri f. nagariensis TaxID=3068 RepID=D8U5C7_VOLCA|nr:uncharacterized protein VOLCADRAFT_94648 [Volvox carteri f. nagariensis]EFJ45127.1 hypothetical protein VOLCADRAFT_94648 [Volvox carteri f. nagariensis]|eukprot:XP_002953803.1 hypothetical protein VOLCADRAFT_94648 [Volvox carteri f. nagariensis]